VRIRSALSKARTYATITLREMRGGLQGTAPLPTAVGLAAPRDSNNVGLELTVMGKAWIRHTTLDPKLLLHQRRCACADMLSNVPLSVLFEGFVGLGRWLCYSGLFPPFGSFPFRALPAVRTAPVFLRGHKHLLEKRITDIASLSI
jgi:hypothetical protein